MAPIINITNGIIDDITMERNSTFITVTYTDLANNIRVRQTVRLVVNNTTVILDEHGNPLPITRLRIGTIINALISSAMTRSIPPQSTAFLIRVIRQPARENITVGRVVNVDRENRSFTVIQNRNPASVIVFNVPDNARFFTRSGRPMNFSMLVPGLRVSVRHANFMTASIPPQTTAFEIKVL